MKHKNKNILFSIDLTIKENKLYFEEVLKQKFKTVKFIKCMIDFKKKRFFYIKIVREISRAFPKVNFFKNLFNQLITKEYKKEIYSNKEEYDYFFVIAGGYFTHDYIKEIKQRYPKIKTVLYLQDNLKYVDHSREYIASFDYVFTFDKNDARKYNFYFRPTFYTGYNLSKEKYIEFDKREYSLYFVGLLRDINRYNIAKKLNDFMIDIKQNSLIKIFTPKKKLKILPQNYDKTLIMDKKITFYEDLENTRNSKVILDLNYGEQIGLTLRVYNALESSAKILTTNQDIINYDFFNSNNIKIIKNIDDIMNIEVEFFMTKPEPINEKILKRYSIDGFIDEIFELVDNYVK